LLYPIPLNDGLLNECWSSAENADDDTSSNNTKILFTSLSLIKLLTYLPTKRVKIKPAEIMINIEYD
jgi:hypothetical protein